MLWKGIEIAENIGNRIVARREGWRRKPCIGMLRVGKDPADGSYAAGIRKRAKKLELDYRTVQLERDATTAEVLEALEALNRDPEVDGIIVFRPLPLQIDSELVEHAIDPEKDVDAMHPTTLGLTFDRASNQGKPVFSPATPKAVMALLEDKKVSLAGKRVLIVNRSAVFGRPLANLMLNESATITVAHSKTTDMNRLVQEADIVVTAVGRGGVFDASQFHKDQIVIDVGMWEDEDGNLRGDLSTEEIEPLVYAITPAPIGGVGSITTTVLLEQVVQAYESKVATEKQRASADQRPKKYKHKSSMKESV